VDVIGCLDACFKQRRRQGKLDPQLHHPSSVFVSEAEVQRMAALVNKRKSQSPHKDQHAGEYEDNIKVPNAVLDGCEQSFFAADEKRQNTNTEFFSDTGLMALLCRHDRVLWLANMTTAGEKQYYALALLHKFFTHLPTSMQVGILYDIGCQLHRSCVKWDFLKEFSGRITFGISVFHAYGHQWPCQIIYHPRKRKGFGLTDGEGCERFWNLIKPQIPALRVSGVRLCSFYSVLYSHPDSIISAFILLIFRSNIMMTGHCKVLVDGFLANGFSARRRNWEHYMTLRDLELMRSC
jgi:hypothetical protein